MSKYSQRIYQMLESAQIHLTSSQRMRLETEIDKALLGPDRIDDSSLEDFILKRYFPAITGRPPLESTSVILRKVAEKIELLCRLIVSHDRYLQDSPYFPNHSWFSACHHIADSEREFLQSVVRDLAREIREQRYLFISSTPTTMPPESSTESTSPTSSSSKEEGSGELSGANPTTVLFDELGRVPTAPRVPRPKAEVDAEEEWKDLEDRVPF